MGSPSATMPRSPKNRIKILTAQLTFGSRDRYSLLRWRKIDQIRPGAWLEFMKHQVSSNITILEIENLAELRTRLYQAASAETSNLQSLRITQLDYLMAFAVCE